jgi:hypothetical protein
MDWERNYYENGNKPYIFYVIFGVTTDELNISRKKHRVDEIPSDIQVIKYDKSDNRNYIEGFYDGYLGTILKEKDINLYEKVKNSESCMIIAGEIVNDSNLEYIRNIIGIVQSVLEQGAFCVLDIQTLNWYTSSEWESEFFINEQFNPFKHVVILVSKMENSMYWIHTRGMRKFGRADISVLNVPEESINTAAQIVNRIIDLMSQGVVIYDNFKMNINGNKISTQGSYSDDFENPDFNNEYCEFSWENFA